MVEKEIRLEILRKRVEHELSRRLPGRDYRHSLNVEATALKLLDVEKGLVTAQEVYKTIQTISAISLLYDVFDKEVDARPDVTRSLYYVILKEIGFTQSEARLIVVETDGVHSGEGQIPGTVAGRLVQDAVRLTHSGAVGVFQFLTRGTLYRTSFEDTISLMEREVLAGIQPYNTESARAIAASRARSMKEVIRQYRIEVAMLDDGFLNLIHQCD